MTTLASRLAGGVWGALVGDALGVPFEFRSPDSLRSEWIRMVGGGTYGQPAGTWSDDGALTLALLDSLLSGGFDPADQARRYLAWYEDGTYTPDGDGPFDVGGTTRVALERIRAGTAAESAGAEREMLLGVSDVLAHMQTGARTHHIVVGGVANLADEAAHWRRETVRRLFEALERESDMLHLLRDVTAEDVSVTIGAEHPTTGDWEASIVSAPFRAGDASLGTIGVVGPTAMDYVSVMASVRAVARRLSELATELDA